jgi:hypothetical protein
VLLAPEPSAAYDPDPQVMHDFADTISVLAENRRREKPWRADDAVRAAVILPATAKTAKPALPDSHQEQ